MSALKTIRENPDDNFDVPSADDALDFKPGVTVVPDSTRIVEILGNAQIDPNDSLSDQLATLEDQPRDKGKEEA